MVRNTNGATPALMSDRNMSPSSFSCKENLGNKKPTAMPSTSDSNTCMPSLRYQGVFLDRDVIVSPPRRSGLDCAGQFNCLVDHLWRKAKVVFRIGQAIYRGPIKMGSHFRHCRQRFGQRAALFIDGATGVVHD